MWVYDLITLDFLAVNDAAIACYGYSREDFLKMTIKDIRPREDVPKLLTKVEGVRRGVPASGLDHAGIWRHRKKDGTIVDAEVTSHPLTFAGCRAELVLAAQTSPSAAGPSGPCASRNAGSGRRSKTSGLSP